MHTLFYSILGFQRPDNRLGLLLRSLAYYPFVELGYCDYCIYYIVCQFIVLTSYEFIQYCIVLYYTYHRHPRPGGGGGCQPRPPGGGGKLYGPKPGGICGGGGGGPGGICWNGGGKLEKLCGGGGGHAPW